MSSRLQLTNEQPDIPTAETPGADTPDTDVHLITFVSVDSDPLPESTQTDLTDPTAVPSTHIVGQPVLAHILRSEGYTVVPFNAESPGSTPIVDKSPLKRMDVRQRYNTLPDRFFRHAAGATSMWSEMLVELPFNLYHCEVFTDSIPYIEATHGPVPTEAELSKAMDSLRLANGAFVAEAQARARQQCLRLDNEEPPGLLAKLRRVAIPIRAGRRPTGHAAQLAEAVAKHATQMAKASNHGSPTPESSHNAADPASAFDSPIPSHCRGPDLQSDSDFGSDDDSASDSNSEGRSAGIATSARPLPSSQHEAHTPAAQPSSMSTPLATTTTLSTAPRTQRPRRRPSPVEQLPSNFNVIAALRFSQFHHVMAFHWGPVFDGHYRFPIKQLPGTTMASKRVVAKDYDDLLAAQWRKVVAYQNERLVEGDRLPVNDARSWYQEGVLPPDPDLELDFGQTASCLGSVRIVLLPWVQQHLSKFFSNVGALWMDIVRRLAEQDGLLGHQIPAMVRVQQTFPTFTESFMRDRVAKAVFGDWAVCALPGSNSYVWATGPPAADGTATRVPESDPAGKRYRRQLQSAIRILCEAVYSHEAKQLRRIRHMDLHTLKTAFDKVDEERLNKHRGKVPREMVDQHYTRFFSFLHKYGQYPLPPWFEEFSIAFISAIDARSDLSDDILQTDGAYNSLKRHLRRQTCLSPEDVATRDNHDVDRPLAIATADLRDHSPSSAADPFATTPGQPGVEIGIDHLKQLDGWDLAEYLGIAELQTSEARQLAEEAAIMAQQGINPSACRLKDGSPDRDAAGQYQRLYPRHHHARNAIIWPYFHRFDAKQCFNQQLCDSRLESAGHLVLQEDTHRPLYPKVHQIVAVANILERGYAHNPWTEPMWGTILADEVGMGKTWIPFMLMTILRYHRKRLHEDPRYRPKVMTAIHRHYFNKGQNPSESVRT